MANAPFCKTCGSSSLYCRILAPGPMHGVYHVAAGTLKDWKDIQLDSEIFIGPQARWLYSFTNTTQQIMTSDQFYALTRTTKEESKIRD